MTEPIIINDVDVSGCEFLTQDEYRNPLSEEVEEQLCCGQENEFADKICTENAPNLHCERNSDCWYKQLQRKTAECVKYKKLKEYLKIDEITTIEDGDLVFTSQFLQDLIDSNSILENKLQIAMEAIKQIRYNEIESFDMTESEYEIEMSNTEFSKTLDICEQALERIKNNGL